MKTIIFAVAAILLSLSFAQAQIPEGRFVGGVSNNSFQDMCRLQSAEIRFVPGRDGNFSVEWQERGMFQSPFNGFCQNDFDAEFTTTGKAYEWNVNFHFNYNLIFGTAKLDGNTLTIKASFSASPRNDLSSFETTLVLSQDQKSFRYNRMINTYYGPTRFAMGTLYSR